MCTTSFDLLTSDLDEVTKCKLHNSTLQLSPLDSVRECCCNAARRFVVNAATSAANRCIRKPIAFAPAHIRTPSGLVQSYHLKLPLVAAGATASATAAVVLCAVAAAGFSVVVFASIVRRQRTVYFFLAPPAAKKGALCCSWCYSSTD
jgi:hypothetical protein